MADEFKGPDLILDPVSLAAISSRSANVLGLGETAKAEEAPTNADRSQPAASADRVRVDSSSVDVASTATVLESDKLSGTYELVKTAMVGDETIIVPPNSPEMLYLIYRLSAYLSPIIEAFSTNVYETGYALQPTVDPDDPDDQEQIEWAMMYLAGGWRGDAKAPRITKTELDVECDRVRVAIKMEEIGLRRFFASCCAESSYLDLVTLTGQDLEITGNAYWEARRSASGAVARLSRVPSSSCRATLQNRTEAAYRELVPETVLSWTSAEQSRRFRRYIQIQQGMIIARFKEFGDPRVVSRSTGEYFNDLTAMRASWAEGARARAGAIAEPLAATEIIHFRLPYAGSPVYGNPSWVGNYPGLTGARNLDEENLGIVSDSAIPSLMLLISGGRMDGEDFKRLKDQFANRKPGRKQLMLIQAMAAGSVPAGVTATPTIKVERTKGEQTTDMLFQNFDKRVEEKAHSSSRIPIALVGKGGGNKATTEAMYRFANDQVFDPRRTRFDSQINTYIMPNIGARWHRYVTKARRPRDPQVISAIVAEQMGAGSLSPNEAREIIGEVFDIKLRDLPGLWAELPPKITTAVLQTKNHVTSAALLDEAPGAAGRLAEAVRGALLAESAPSADAPIADTSETATSETEPEPIPGEVQKADNNERDDPEREEPTLVERPLPPPIESGEHSSGVEERVASPEEDAAIVPEEPVPAPVQAEAPVQEGE